MIEIIIGLVVGFAIIGPFVVFMSRHISLDDPDDRNAPQ